MKKNALNWFEIYVADLERAKAFYEKILGVTLTDMPSEMCEMAAFPCDEKEGVGGALMKIEHCQPGPGGTLIYLNVEGELDAVVARIQEAEGKIVLEKMAIPPHGFIAVFEDSEGNNVGLHSLS
ncbi:MAG: VOC family protein [Roseibacillus sp.]